MVEIKQVDLERLRAAFDGFDVIEKNIVLRKAYDAIVSYEARMAALTSANNDLLAALKGLLDLYDTDEGCRSLPAFIRAASAYKNAGGR